MTQKTQGIFNGIRKTEWIFAIIGAILLFAMMVVGAADVIGRYVFNSPIRGVLEISRILMSGVIIFTWAYTQAARAHATVDFVISRYSPRTRRVTDFASDLISLVFFGLIAWQTLKLGLLSLSQHRTIYITPEIVMPLADVHFIISLGACVLCLELITQVASFAFGAKMNKIEA